MNYEVYIYYLLKQSYKIKYKVALELEILLITIHPPFINCYNTSIYHSSH